MFFIIKVKKSKVIIKKVINFVFAKKGVDVKDIPIIINNFNRVTTLSKLITTLEVRGYKNIYIIDNASTYKPLLKYYEDTPYKVFRLKKI